ncbi:MAG: efflux RND transporter permease subunit [Acidobacteriota bacterium]
MTVVDVALGKRVTVLFLTGALILLGLLAYSSLPREKFPDIQVPVVFVTTPYPGAAPLEVEQQITNLVERELAGLDGVDKMDSRSMESASLVTVEFVAGTDVDASLQKVRDRVDLAAVDFPDEAEEPILQEVSFSEIPVIQVHLSGDVGPVVLKQLAEELQDEIEIVRGVLRADLVGGRERQVQVAVDPRRLRTYDLALDDVVQAVEDENVSIPGGDLDLGPVSYAVRVPGEVRDPLEVADFVIEARDGRPITVRDVADVTFGFEDRESTSRIRRPGEAAGRESVALQIQKRVGANVLEVIDEIKATVDSTSTRWPAGVEVTFLADASDQILQQVRELENSILSGLLLVIVVLMFALGWRTATLVALSIPFSMLLTFIAIQLSGTTLNTVVLFALVLAVGMLVDNAVVVIENIYRFIEEGHSRIEAASLATREVGGAITVSTLTTVAAFSPLLFWPGMIGDFMGYVPGTVILALLASLIVAFTINPVLCSRFLRPAPADAEPRPPGLLDRAGAIVTGRYRRLLAWALDHRAATLALTAVLFIGVVALYGAYNSGTEFIAEEQPNQIKVDLALPPGTRLAETDAAMRELSGRIVDLPDLVVTATAVGRGSQSDDFGDSGATPHKGRLTLDLRDRQVRSQSSVVTLEEARERLGSWPGGEIEVAKLDDGLPVGPPVSIELAGEDFEVLGQIAERVRTAIADIPGLVSLESDFDLARPEVILDVDRAAAARLGLTMANIAGTVRTAINGTDASTYRRGDEQIDIVVRLAESSRTSIDDLERLALVGDTGEQVPLGAVATVHRTESLLAINHRDRRRMVTVSGETTRPELAEPVRAEVLRRLGAIPDLLPAGYTLGFGGQAEEEEESKAFLGTAFLYALILVLTLMVGKFDSLWIPVIIISSVGMSLFGVLAGLLITGTTFSIVMTGVGLISLAGIVVNNAIVLLDYAEQQRALGLPRREVVMTTGLRRLRPVLLTATTTILGLLPLTTGVEFDFRSLSFATGSGSSDYWRAMGVAVIFGLAFATLVTLVVVPVLYDLLWGLRDRLSGATRGDGEEALDAVAP